MNELVPDMLHDSDIVKFLEFCDRSRCFAAIELCKS